MCLTILAVESAATLSGMLQENLKEFLRKVLTTMLLPCTYVQGTIIIAHLFAKCNSTREERVLKV